MSEAKYVGNAIARIALPSKDALLKILAEHSLVRFTGKAKRAYLVGSFAAQTPHAESDVDVLLEVSPRKGRSAQELEEKYRQKLRQYFVTHNIRGKADHLHPQWDGRRIDMYFTYGAASDSRPRILLD